MKWGHIPGLLKNTICLHCYRVIGTGCDHNMGNPLLFHIYNISPLEVILDTCIVRLKILTKEFHVVPVLTAISSTPTLRIGPPAGSRGCSHLNTFQEHNEEDFGRRGKSYSRITKEDCQDIPVMLHVHD